MRGREGAGTATACPHGHFQTRDNRWVAIACTTDKMFGRLAGAMGKPELASAGRYGQQSRRLAARDAVDALVGRWVRSMSLDEVMEICLAHEVPSGPLNTIADIFADPHFKARGNLVTIDDPEVGAVVVPAVIPRRSETPGRIAHLGPALGDANEEVLGNLLGLSGEEMARLRDAKVI